MDPNSLPLLCDPQTHEVLELQNNALVDVRSGRRYPLRDGIPDFLDNVSGQNKKYPELYDRIAAFYDLSEKLYVWLKQQRNFRRAYLDELEVPSSARVPRSLCRHRRKPSLSPFRRGALRFGPLLGNASQRRCRKNLQKWRRTAELFHGEAEHLPFRDNVFDVVFHVGGINFFNDEAGAIQEMIRVTKPRTKILIVDETEKVVKEQYEKTPLIGKYFKKRTGVVTDPLLLVPAGMAEVRCKNILEGKAYCLTFRKP